MPSFLGTTRTVVSVIAPHSGSGKTAFVAHLVHYVRGVGCLKTSPGDSPRRGAEASESRLRSAFSFDDADQINLPGKDTASYMAAGASHVERLRYRGRGFPAGLEAALARFPPTMPLVVESSAAVALLRPVAVVMVVHPPIREMKPSTKRILPVVTDVLVNTSDVTNAGAEAGQLMKTLPLLQPAHIWAADLPREPPPSDMLLRLRRLLWPEPAEP